MAMSATQKIISAHASDKQIKAGENVVAKVDLCLANDITAPVAIKEIQSLNGQIYDKSALCLVLDHFTPNKDIKSAEQCKITREFAKKNGITHFYDVGKAGIEHALLPEQGLVKPSALILGADSHTCTYGALGAFSTGVGSTDLAVATVTGKCWLRVPEAIKVEVSGRFKKMVSGKDLILHIIGLLGVDGANYCSLEFSGDGLCSLSADDRFTIANMAVECGAKNAFFPVDSITEKYLIEAGITSFEKTVADDDFEYQKTLKINLDNLDYTVAYPDLPSNTHTLKGVCNIIPDQVVIGSCTNGRISDLKAADEVLRGRKVADGVRVIIIPATPQIYKDAIDKGYITDFINAGAAVSAPSCGPCLGGHLGVLASGETAISTTNRNFVGRMGAKDSKIFLASPAVAAASAVKGRLCRPEDLE